jgi:hypothetical protein
MFKKEIGELETVLPSAMQSGNSNYNNSAHAYI